jgi:hypothetical protein
LIDGARYFPAAALRRLGICVLQLGPTTPW